MNVNKVFILIISLSLITTINNVMANCPSVVINSKGISIETAKIIDSAVNNIAMLSADKDRGEMDRLRRRAREVTISALASEGYFSPIVDLNICKTQYGEVWRIFIDPGNRTLVADVKLIFRGAISDINFLKKRETLINDWSLKLNDPFISNEWNQAKSCLLNSISSNNFLFARIVNSSAYINRNNSTALLKVEIDSGPEVFMGQINIHGLKKIPLAFIEKYLKYNKYSEFNQDLLNHWQQNLQSLKFFRGAFVYIDVTELNSLKSSIKSYESKNINNKLYLKDKLILPIHISVLESPMMKISSSFGIDSDAGLRIETVYKKSIIMSRAAASLSTGLGIDRFRQRAFLDLDLTTNMKLSNDSLGLLIDRSNSHGLDVKRLALGFTREKTNNKIIDTKAEYDTRFGSILAHDSVVTKTGLALDLPSFSLTSEWIRRSIDDKYNPRDGSLLSLNCGAGITLDKLNPYCLSKIRIQKWYPITRKDVITLRCEIGKIWRDCDQLPDDFGFRTGGSRAIRGYNYQSLGPKYGTAVVGVPALAVSSIEYNHYFNSIFGLGFFTDIGDAAISFSEMELAVGYGVGIRFLTPAGPLLFDLAYGHREKQFKLHFSLGISF